MDDIKIARCQTTMTASLACVIAYYNGSAFIDRAVESVYAQTVPFQEVIIVDDGSKESEAEYLDSISERYPVIIHRKVNGGQGSARNQGVQLAKSDYVCFLDQDDFFLPRHNQILLGGVDADDPMFGWVYGDLYEADGDGAICRTGMIKEHSRHPKTSIMDLVRGDMFILPSASLVSRRAFLDVGGFDEQFTGYEDDDLFLRMFRKGWSNVYIDRSVTVWCIHSGSTSYSVKMSRSRFRYIKKLASMFPDDPAKARYFFRDLIMPRFSSLLLLDLDRAVAASSQHAAELLEIVRQYRELAASFPSVHASLIESLDQSIVNYNRLMDSSVRRDVGVCVEPAGPRAISHANQSFGDPGRVSPVARDGAFDREWYLKRYPDVAASGMDPYYHYLNHGVNEGRLPVAP
jgi:glycosyltransferase involved in cell wall biosynthesis